MEVGKAASAAPGTWGGGGGVSETQEVEAPDPGPGGHSGKRATLSLVFAL